MDKVEAAFGINDAEGWVSLGNDEAGDSAKILQRIQWFLSVWYGVG